MRVRQTTYGICAGCEQEFLLYGWDWQWKIPPHTAHGRRVESEPECMAVRDVEQWFASPKKGGTA